MQKRPTRALVAIVALALAHAAFFITYQRPDWTTAWDDQVGYQRLGHVLATTGKFTRYPDADPFVPETIRTPLYPMFVAAVYRVAGERHTAVAVAQALVFAAIVLLVYALTARISTPRVALAAALVTALYPPLPYYGALVLSDLLSVVFVVAALWTAIRAIQIGDRKDFALTGALLGLATLTRPSFAFFPIALVGCVGAVAFWRRERHRLVPWAWTFGVFALVLAPWLLYNARYLHRLTISPAGGVGRGVWEASWQGTWPGRLQAELTRIADANVNAPDADLDAAVQRVADESRLPVEPMLEYVHQWRDFRRLWDTPTDPRERAMARVAADDAYWRAGIANIARDRMGHVIRRVTIGEGVLWIGEIPVRYSRINQLPPIVIRVMWLAQALLLVLAMGGLLFAAARSHPLEAAALASLFLYIAAVHLSILAEPRYSLAAKPIMLALAVIALAEIAHRMLPQTGDYLP
jgi:4-amino-4-deoxy-L-arabinose transferase-like glycosyltransferase